MGLVHRALAGALDIVCPTRCAGCDLPGTLLCPDCLASLVLTEPVDACPRCGAPGGRTRCVECEGASFAFDAARSLGPLVRPLSRVVTVYKDGGERRLATDLGALLARVAGDWLAETDVVTWIPASRAAVARRGFDHAALLAAALGERGGVVCADLLVSARVRDQRGLGREARRENMLDTFSVREVSPPERVLIVDDVLTTGATLDAAASTLRVAGSREVRALTVARKIVPSASA